MYFICIKSDHIKYCAVPTSTSAPTVLEAIYVTFKSLSDCIRLTDENEYKISDDEISITKDVFALTEDMIFIICRL